MHTSENCRLCKNPCHFFCEIPRIGQFYQCENCELIQKEAARLLAAEEEIARYQCHENSLHDEGYVKFLTPAVEAVVKRVQVEAVGLDYGSGPEPVLAQLLGQRGFLMSHYDPYFAPDRKRAFARAPFDFITCTEAAEHFYHPEETFKDIFSLLKQDGVLVLMTDRVPGHRPFVSWHYPQDPTHVCFYSEKTMRWLAGVNCCQVELLSQRLAVFTKF